MAVETAETQSGKSESKGLSGRDLLIGGGIIAGGLLLFNWLRKHIKTALTVTAGAVAAFFLFSAFPEGREFVQKIHRLYRGAKNGLKRLMRISGKGIETAVTKGSNAAFNSIAGQKAPPAEVPAKPKAALDAPPKPPPASAKPPAEIPEAPKTKTARKAFNADVPAVPGVPPKAAQETAEGL